MTRRELLLNDGYLEATVDCFVMQIWRDGAKKAKVDMVKWLLEYRDELVKELTPPFASGGLVFGPNPNTQ